MSVTDTLLENNAAYAATFNGPLPLPPAMKVAVLACIPWISGFDEGMMWLLPGYGNFLGANIDPDSAARESSVHPPGFEDCIGWMLPVTGDGVPAQWTVTFGVDDTDAVAARAEALGGTAVAPPFDAGRVRLATVADPHGAVFSVSRYAPSG